MAIEVTEQNESFRRSYVACSSCRSRKVRCILEGEPPCARCKREHRDCLFNTHEKSYKGRRPPRWASTASHMTTSNDTRPQPSPHGQASMPASNGISRTPTQLQGNGSAQATPAGTKPTDFVSPTAASLTDGMVSTVMTNSSDALNVLFNSARGGSRAATRLGGTSAPQIGGTSTGIGKVISVLSEPSEETLDFWDKFRFVRSGWLTAQEAVTYVDLFFEYIAPLSAVQLEAFRSHEAHVKLVQEEPMLCCTILMIGSRLFTLPGSGGFSRTHNIHRRIWQHCEHLLQRLILGQEKQATAKIRILGTIESLLLISDWPPRAINLPPETEGWDNALVIAEHDRDNRRRRDDDAPLTRWREDVFEPAKRSERMSWMLLGVAMNLAHELGVFAELTHSQQDMRKWRLRRLLYVYVTKASLPLGATSMLPEHMAYQMAQAPPLQSTVDKSWKAFMDSWIELTKLSTTTSAMFFQSRTHTRTQLLNGTYAPLLDHVLTSFKSLHAKITSLSSNISEKLRATLLIEYHHLKACTETIATQAVVEKAQAFVQNGNSQELTSGFAAFTSSQDARFLRDVVHDASEVLRIATSAEFRDCIPYVATRIRTFVVSSSVFLLKAISVGSSDTDAIAALKTIEQCAATLQQQAPDDMCFASRSAALIERQTAQLRANLISTTQVGARNPLVSDWSTETLAEDSNPNADHVTELGNGPVLPESDALMEGFADFAPLQPPGPGGRSSDWLTLPYDHMIAPFHAGSEQVSYGFELDSLDFLWNLNG